MRYEIIIDPIGKPRMTRRDKWKKRPCVTKYYRFKDAVKSHHISIDYEENFEITFNISMPKSWSKKKRREMLGRPHKQKPDIDNLLKAYFDCVMNDDSVVWSVKAQKFWSVNGSIVLDQN